MKKTTVINFANFDFPLDVLPHLEVLQFGHLIFSRRFHLVNVQDLLNLLLCIVPFPPLSPLHRCRDERGQNKIEIFHLFSKKNPCGRFVVISTAHTNKFLEALATLNIPHNPSEKVQNLLREPRAFSCKFHISILIATNFKHFSFYFTVSIIYSNTATTNQNSYILEILAVF